MWKTFLLATAPWRRSKRNWKTEDSVPGLEREGARSGTQSFGQWPQVRLEGPATGAKTLYVDEACSKEVDDDYLKSLVQGLRFKPALDGGFPATSVLKLKLADLKF